MNIIVAINTAYVQAKGKTFFCNHFLFDNPLANDPFINETLEHLRQNARVAITREDEEQLEQTFRVFAGLVDVYVAIDYSDEHSEKTHANLAASYLASAVQSAVLHSMPDVLLEGVRLMGHSAQLFLINSKPNDMTILAEKIATIASICVAREDHRPVIVVGMEQLARLTFNLFGTKNADVSYASADLKKHVSSIARIFLEVSDAPLSNAHSAYLGPYFSRTRTGSLPSLLAELANTLARAAADDETAGAISRNLECWAEDLYQLAELLLLAAIARKSHFTFDMIHWVAHVTKVLVVISNGPACRQHTKEELRKHARRLLLVFSRIPDDKNAISFVESSQMTEVLFESAMDALSYDCPELVESAATLLLDWAFKAGRHHTGWALLERSLYGAAAFALVRGVPNEVAALKVKITAAVNKASAPDQELRDRAGRNMRRRANTLYRNGHVSSSIEQTMSRLDHTILAPLLIDIANLLSPTSGKESELDRD